jgi:hypothetical protein
MSGPYKTERDALADCDRVFDALRGKRGTMESLNAEILARACAVAGVQLGDYDWQVLNWIASSEPQVSQVVADLIRRAVQAGTWRR